MELVNKEENSIKSKENEEKTEVKDDIGCNNEKQKEINEKVSKKLRQFQEIRSILNIKNCALRFKHNLSLIIQERIERSIDLNPSKNNYYTKTNPNTDVFDIGSIIKTMFDPYLKSHNIDINAEIENYEKQKNEYIEQNLASKTKKFGVQMREDLVNKKNEENIGDNSEGNNKRRHHNLYVVNDNKKIKEKKQPGVIERAKTNCKRKSVLDKMKAEEELRKKKEEEEKKLKEENEKNKKNENRYNNFKNKVTINTNKYMPPPVDMIIKMNRRNDNNNINNPNQNQNSLEKTEKEKENSQKIEEKKEKENPLNEDEKKEKEIKEEKEDNKKELDEDKKEEKKENKNEINDDIKTDNNEDNKLNIENNLIKKEKEEENKVLDNEIKNNENNMENNNNNNLINSRKRASVDNVYENREKIRPSTPKKKKSTKEVYKTRTYKYDSRIRRKYIEKVNHSEKVNIEPKDEHNKRELENNDIEKSDFEHIIRSANKEQKNINNDEKKEIEEKSKSINKDRQKGHRHHHYQHYKKPERFIMKSNLDFFSIISNNN